MKTKFVQYCSLATIVIIAISMSACRDAKKYPGYEYMPDMYRSVSYETYDQNPLFKDSMGALKPVAGTVARGHRTFPFDESTDGYNKAGSMAINPLEANAANKEEGKRLYNIYCGHCHGETGAGDGILVQNGKFAGVPNYATGNSSRGGMMKDLTDGKIYHAITYGINMMGSHASQLDTDERWKIVMHVKQLLKVTETATADSTAKPAQ